MKSEQPQMVTIPASSNAQETENTQLDSLSQTNEGGNFITMETRPVAMVTESVLSSMQDAHGIVTDYQGNSHSLLGDRDEKLTAQDTQPFKLSGQTTVQPQETYETKIPSSEIPRMMETPQDILVSMETPSKEAEEHTPVNENSLKTAEEEQIIQSYTMQTPCTESTNNCGQMNVPLMFESGQQLSEDEASSISHSNVVPIVNNATEVFTQ